MGREGGGKEGMVFMRGRHALAEFHLCPVSGAVSPGAQCSHELGSVHVTACRSCGLVANRPRSGSGLWPTDWGP